MLKTGENVSWTQQGTSGEQSTIRYGVIIGWYEQDAPIVLLPSVDPEGNAACVIYASALTSATQQSNSKETDKEALNDNTPHNYPTYTLPENPTPEHLLLATIYQTLRLDVEELENLIGEDCNTCTSVKLVFDEKEHKRLDKATTIIKEGLKKVKKVLKAQGFSELKPTSQNSEYA
jgi:hypothetical protein